MLKYLNTELFIQVFTNVYNLNIFFFVTVHFHNIKL